MYHPSPFKYCRGQWNSVIILARFTTNCIRDGNILGIWWYPFILYLFHTSLPIKVFFAISIIQQKLHVPIISANFEQNNQWINKINSSELFHKGLILRCHWVGKILLLKSTYMLSLKNCQWVLGIFRDLCVTDKIFYCANYGGEA